MIASIQELDRIREECRSMVTKRSLASAGAAVLPVPGADIVADIGLLANLLPAISARFGLSEDQVEKMDPSRAERVLVFASGIGNNLIGRAITKRMVVALLKRMGARIGAASVARYVPLLGSAVAATISFGAMKLAGNAHIDDCYRTARALLEEDGAVLSEPSSGDGTARA